MFVSHPCYSWRWLVEENVLFAAEGFLSVIYELFLLPDYCHFEKILHSMTTKMIHLVKYFSCELVDYSILYKSNIHLYQSCPCCNQTQVKCNHRVHRNFHTIEYHPLISKTKKKQNPFFVKHFQDNNCYRPPGPFIAKTIHAQ